MQCVKNLSGESLGKKETIFVTLHGYYEYYQILSTLNRMYVCVRE